MTTKIQLIRKIKNIALECLEIELPELNHKELRELLVDYKAELENNKRIFSRR